MRLGMALKKGRLKGVPTTLLPRQTVRQVVMLPMLPKCYYLLPVALVYLLLPPSLLMSFDDQDRYNGVSEPERRN